MWQHEVCYMYNLSTGKTNKWKRLRVIFLFEIFTFDLCCSIDFMQNVAIQCTKAFKKYIYYKENAMSRFGYVIYS